MIDSNLVVDGIFIGLQGIAISLIALLLISLVPKKRSNGNTTLILVAFFALLLLPVLYIFMPAASIDLPINNLVPTQTVSDLTSIEGGESGGSGQGNQLIDPAMPESSSNSITALPKQTGILEWLAMIWLAGFGLIVIISALRNVSILILLTWAKPIDTAEKKLVDNSLDRLGIENGVPVFASDLVSVPLVLGLFQPKLVVPPVFFKWPEDRQRSVILHELAHVKRRDNLTHFLIQVACALHWFNPVAWLLKHRFLMGREMACDQLVIRNGVKRTDYARHLTQIVSEKIPPFRQILLPTAFASKNTLKTRIESILFQGQGTRLSLKVGMAVLLLVFALGMSTLKPGSAAPVMDSAGLIDNSGENFPKVFSQAKKGYDAFYHREEYGLAAKHFGEIVKNYPFAGHIWIMLGQAEYKTGQYLKATASLTRGLQMVPTYDNIPFIIARCNLNLGRTEAAVAWAKAGLAEPPEDLVAAEKLLHEFREEDWWYVDDSVMYQDVLREALSNYGAALPDFNEIGSSQELEALIDIAGNKYNPSRLREDAITWIGAHGSSVAGDFLEAVIVQEPDEDVAEEAIEAYAEMTMGKCGDTFSYLMRVCPYPVTRFNLAVELLRVNPEEAMDVMEELLFKVMDEDLGEDIVSYISRVGTQRAQNLLRRSQQEHPLEDVRRRAARLLAKQ